MLERLQRRGTEGQSDDRDRTRDAVTSARRTGLRRPAAEGQDDEASGLALFGLARRSN